MRVAALCVLIGLLFVVGSNSVTSPSRQCDYLRYYLLIGYRDLLPSLVPSISSSCLERYKDNHPRAYCVAECQSLYSALSQCTSSATADDYASNGCGRFNNSDCDALFMQDTNLYYSLKTACNNGTYCSSSCSTAIAALEQFSGCCRHKVLNGPKALCGQPLIAPCSTVLNSGSVATPSRECAYLSSYRVLSEMASLTPSLDAKCRSILTTEGFGRNICIPECQSYFTFLATCYDFLSANYSVSLLCGTFNNQECLDIIIRNSTLIDNCDNSTYCSPSCVNAIAASEQYGGCCFAPFINGPKALCGQQPMSVCDTVVQPVQPTQQPSPTCAVGKCEEGAATRRCQGDVPSADREEHDSQHGRANVNVYVGESVLTSLVSNTLQCHISVQKWKNILLRQHYTFLQPWCTDILHFQ